MSACRTFRTGCVNLLDAGWQARCLLRIGLRKEDLVAEAQDLLVLLDEAQGRGIITWRSTSFHRTLAPFGTPALIVSVCRLRKAAGSNAKLFFDAC